MKLGGWMRTWIVLSVLLGVFVALIAYDGRPTRDRIVREWYGAASEVIAEKITAAEDQYVPPDKVRDAYFNASERENLERLKKFETAPSEKAKLFSADVGRINQLHEKKLESLPRSAAIYWAQVFGWWLAICALLFLAGWTIGWVIRGFRGRAA